MIDAELTSQFTRAYYRSRADWFTHYKGYLSVKCPTDLWTIQEIIHETRPQLIIETGTFAAGSALFYADLLRGTQARVVTIDVKPPNAESLDPSLPWPPRHDRLTIMQASSVAESTREHLISQYRAGIVPTMVLLDSQHEAYHVLQELELWSKVVTAGCYLVVEDTCVAGHPVEVEDALGHESLEPALASIQRKGGPMEAMTNWFVKEPEGRWQIDRGRERHLLTYNPCGYIYRTEQP